MKIKHPVLKYYGSKFRLAQWIISHFPPHRHYVEPFGGAANVLLVKEPSKLETYNDLNQLIVNFFRVLRDQPDELIHKIKLTPWARDEFINCLTEDSFSDSVELARKLFFRLWMSISGSMTATNGCWRRQNRKGRTLAEDIRPENLFIASERFRKVQIENTDAFKLIETMDSKDTLFYLDPPYVFSTRTSNKEYSHEMTNDSHREFAALVHKLKGFVIISGYPSDIYKDLFERHNWKRIDRQANINGGAQRTESLWISPITQKALISFPIS